MGCSLIGRTVTAKVRKNPVRLPAEGKTARRLSEKGGARLKRLPLKPQGLLDAGVVVRVRSRTVAAIVPPMIGHRVSDNRAADAADNQTHRAANDRPANRTGNGASYRAILIRHGGRGIHECRENGRGRQSSDEHVKFPVLAW